MAFVLEIELYMYIFAYVSEINVKITSKNCVTIGDLK